MYIDYITLYRFWQVKCKKLSVYGGVFGSAEEVIDGNAEVIGEKYKRFIVRLALFIFISAYRVLIEVKVHGELKL